MKLALRNVCKKYRDFYAIKDFSMELSEGIHGILGPNGAGKSTLMNLLTENLELTSGEITLDGKNIVSMGEAYRSLIGYMPQQQGFYEQFSPTEFLHYIGGLKDIKKSVRTEQIAYWLEKLNLYQWRNQRMGGFSGGMLQRVLLAQALLGSPKILILDEPTAGLDPRERINMRNIIAEISKDKIILIATHIVSDIELIADDIILTRQGQCVRQGTTGELLETLQGKVGECPCKKEEILSLQERYGVGNIFQQSDGVYFRKVGDDLPENFRPVSENLSLEDVYLYYFEIR